MTSRPCEGKADLRLCHRFMQRADSAAELSLTLTQLRCFCTSRAEGSIQLRQFTNLCTDGCYLSAMSNKGTCRIASSQCLPWGGAWPTTAGCSSVRALAVVAG